MFQGVTCRQGALTSWRNEKRISWRNRYNVPNLLLRLCGWRYLRGGRGRPKSKWDFVIILPADTASCLPTRSYNPVTLHPTSCFKSSGMSASSSFLSFSLYTLSSSNAAPFSCSVAVVVLFALETSSGKSWWAGATWDDSPKVSPACLASELSTSLPETVGLSCSIVTEPAPGWPEDVASAMSTSTVPLHIPEICDNFSWVDFTHEMSFRGSFVRFRTFRLSARSRSNSFSFVFARRSFCFSSSVTRSRTSSSRGNLTLLCKIKFKISSGDALEATKRCTHHNFCLLTNFSFPCETYHVYRQVRRYTW